MAASISAEVYEVLRAVEVVTVEDSHGPAAPGVGDGWVGVVDGNVAHRKDRVPR